MDEIAPPKKRFWPVLRILLLLVILAAALGGYYRYFMNQRVGGQQVYDNLEVLDARLQNLENGILRHEQRIKDLEETTQKLTSNTAPSSSASTIAPAPPVAAPGAPPAAGDDRIAALEKEIAVLKTAAPQQDNARVSQSIRLLSAYHRLSDKVLAGKPFATELSAFEELMPADQSSGSPLSTLAPYADSGIPTFATLLVTFDQAVENLNAAQAVPPASASAWERFKYNLAHLVTIRRIDALQTGGSVDNIVSRAQAKLEREDIEAAVSEIKQLPEATRTNFAAWLDDAQMVTEAPSLIDQVEEQVMQKAFHTDTPPASAASAPPPAKTPAPAPAAATPPATPATPPGDDDATPPAPKT